MAGMKKWIKESRFVMGMLMVQVTATGLQLLSRIIISEGTFVLALMTYRNILGAVCVAPFAFFLERDSINKLSWSVVVWLFVVALTGISMAMGFFYYGLKDTTATYATNFLNLIPITTFLFSVILRIEKLKLHTNAGKIKSLGAILCLGGALTIALYKGKSFYITHHNKLIHSSTPILGNSFKHWTRGTLFLICSCLSYGIWFLSQAKLFKIFPYKYSATCGTCIIATVQQVVLGLCIDRSKAAWHLGWNLQLVTIFYSGILATAATFCLISWAVTNRGPAYPSMFNPLALMFVAITEALFLGEPISVGSLLGMALMVIGLYSFLWAKNREIKAMAAPPLPQNT